MIALRPLGATLVAGSALLAMPVLAAAPAATPTHGITGIWTYGQKDYDSPPPMPLTPVGQKLFDAQHKASEVDLKVLSDEGKKCLPAGMPGMMANEFALEVLETPGRVTMLNEANSVPRTIYLNRTKMTEGLEPMWNGYSIGRWEGETLVVSTDHFNDKIGPLSFGGGIHSSTTRLVERIHLGKTPDDLVDEMTFTDPRYLARPWTVARHYHREPADSELWEYACEVNADGWSERYAGEKQEDKK